MEYYFICEYCGQITTIEHIKKCVVSINDNLIRCYSCGGEGLEYSNSQVSKGILARCIKCVAERKTERHKLYDTLARNGHETVESNLIKCCENIDYSTAEKLLTNGANPNYIRQLYVSSYNIQRVAYNIDGSPIPETDLAQPNTPLKMCIFRLSDCLLTDEERLNLIKLVKILINYGANKKDGRDYFIERYGNSNKTGCWSEILKMLE